MSKMKILVVEDQIITAKDIQEQLEDAGYEVSGLARNYDDAMVLYHETQPDLVLLDIQLEGDKDGVDVARSISSFSQVPIIFLTSYEDDETLKRAKKTLPVAFILKPFRAKEFITNVDLALSNFVKSQRLNNPSISDAVFLPAHDRGHVKVPTGSILYVRGEGAYVKIFTSDKQVFDIATNLGTLMRQLSLSDFARISRNHIINIQHLSKLDQNHVWVENQKFNIGEQYRKELKQSLRFIRTKL